MSLIKITDHGLLKLTSMDAVAGNILAEKLEIKHSKMIRTIKRVMKSEEMRKKDKATSGLIFSAIFKKWEYKDTMNRSRKTFIMNEDALYLVIANSQSAKAHNLKVWFKSEFNKMRQEREERSTSKQLSRPMTDQLKRLQSKLKEEGSGAAPFIYVTLAKQIHRAATNRPMPKGGIDHDSLTLEENHEMGEIRVEVEESVKDMLDAGKTAREVRKAIEMQIKSRMMRTRK